MGVILISSEATNKRLVAQAQALRPTAGLHAKIGIWTGSPRQDIDVRLPKRPHEKVKLQFRASSLHLKRGQVSMSIPLV